jgi:3-isopropylmalate dehydrogenase
MRRGAPLSLLPLPFSSAVELASQAVDQGRMQASRSLTGIKRMASPSSMRRAPRFVGRVRHTTVCKAHKICVLPGDGIGPEIMDVCTRVLTAAGKAEGEQFEYAYELIGGAAIDATGMPLPDKTLATAKESNAVLLAAIGGCACLEPG